MSIFTPFRNKKAVTAAMVLSGSLKLSHTVAWAQQSQRVNVAEINGQTPVPAICDDSTAVQRKEISTNASGNIQLVEHTAASTSRVYVCGYDVMSSSNAGEWQFISGTSTDCSSNETDLSGLYKLSSLSGVVRANTGFPQFVVASSHSFCIETGSTGPWGGYITYRYK